MKTLQLFTFFFSLMILQSCAKKNTSVYWVSGYKTECEVGAGTKECFNILKGDDIDDPDWQNFSAEIEGFEFEEGIMKKIEVKKEKAKKVPADASSIKYTLIKELEKQVDYRALLNGDWIVATLNDNPVNKRIKLPEMKFQLSQMSVSGNGGCNTYFGPIKILTTKVLKFGDLASTEMACYAPDIEQDYFTALNAVNTYQLIGDKLTLYNVEGENVVSFIRKTKTSPQDRIKGMWTMVRLDGNPLNRMTRLPNMEINLDEMSVSGNNSCNEYAGEIKEITASQISFGTIATTRKACPKMEVSDSFNSLISMVMGYKFVEAELILMNKDGKEILAFMMDR